VSVSNDLLDLTAPAFRNGPALPLCRQPESDRSVSTQRKYIADPLTSNHDLAATRRATRYAHYRKATVLMPDKVFAQRLETIKRCVQGSSDAYAFTRTTDCDIVARARVLSPCPSGAGKADQNEYCGDNGSTDAHSEV
jgi:hypothetical protein